MHISPINLLSSARPGEPATLKLAATLYTPATPAAGSTPAGSRAPGLVVGHGAGSQRTNHDEFCRECCTNGFVVLALDFRGHGESAGRADGPLEQDILAAARYLRTAPGIAVGPLGYRGSSMGGFYGLKAAPEAAFAALVLICPAGEDVLLARLTNDETVKYTEEEGATRWDGTLLRAYFRKQDSMALASLVTCPVLLVHARGDEVVPFDHSLRLTAALAGEATLLAQPGGSHTTAQHDPAVHRLIRQWLWAHLV